MRCGGIVVRAIRFPNRLFTLVLKVCGRCDVGNRISRTTIPLTQLFKKTFLYIDFLSSQKKKRYETE